MTKYIAFLRAINVGGRVVKMDVLRSVFESLRFRNVETFIASGNVIFDSTGQPAGLEERIESGLRMKLGYDVITFLRTTGEVHAVAGQRPFDEEGARLMISFFKEAPPAPARKRVLAVRTDADQFQFQGRELYWLTRLKFSESEFSGAVLEKLLGMPSTMRNVTTVRRLAAKYPP